MILAYCPNPKHAPLLDQIAPPPTVEADWSSFERRAPGADRIVVVVESLIGWPHFDAMRHLRLRTPGVPWTLLTSMNETNLVELRRVDVEAVVSIAEPGRTPAVVRDAKVKDLRAAVARSIQEMEGLEGREAEFLVALLLANDPPHTYRQWAKIVHFESGSIKYHFKRCRARGGPSAALCVNFNLILAGMEAGPWARSWERLAATVDVDMRRLKRAARKILGQGDGVPVLSGPVRPGDLIGGFLGLIHRSTARESK